MNWQQLKEALEEEGLGPSEIIHIGWCIDGFHVKSIEIYSDNSAFMGWRIFKDNDGNFSMEKVP